MRNKFYKINTGEEELEDFLESAETPQDRDHALLVKLANDFMFSRLLGIIDDMLEAINPAPKTVDNFKNFNETVYFMLIALRNGLLLSKKDRANKEASEEYIRVIRWLNK